MVNRPRTHYIWNSERRVGGVSRAAPVIRTLTYVPIALAFGGHDLV
ncbi:MAG: hypothetical protein AAFY27_09730 [Pseudomonadota bacterium]